jgi:tetratricopeptide (TPR) repeat protein
MEINSFQHKSVGKAAIIIFLSLFFSFSATDPEELDRDETALFPSEAAEELTGLQQQARAYRAQGYELQKVGNLDDALVLYQKAAEVDPLYAMAFNDLGVVYEAKGLTDEAERYYLKAIKIDPYYLSSYTNLALLYENKRDLMKAAHYWEARARLGAPQDPWTKKARRRLNDVLLVLSETPVKDAKEKEVIGLLKDIKRKKDTVNKGKSNQALAREAFNKAKMSLKKGDQATALKLAIDANLLDPTNSEIDEFINRIQTRLLSR